MPSSVISPSFNERGNIIHVIDAIEVQVAPLVAKVQIVVVDANSPDRVADLVRQRAYKPGSIREKRNSRL